MTFVIARSLSVPVDLRRRSVLDGNVEHAEGLVQARAEEGEGAEAETAEKVDKPKKVKKAAKTAKKKEKTAKPKKE